MLVHLEQEIFVEEEEDSTHLYEPNSTDLSSLYIVSTIMLLTNYKLGNFVDSFLVFNSFINESHR